MRRWYFKLLLLCFWLFTQCRSPYLIKKAKLFLLNCSRCGWWEQDLIRMLARVWKAVSFICVFLHKAEPGLIFKCYGPKGKQRINFFSFSFGWETACSVVTARKKIAFSASGEEYLTNLILILFPTEMLHIKYLFLLSPTVHSHLRFRIAFKLTGNKLAMRPLTKQQSKCLSGGFDLFLFFLQLSVKIPSIFHLFQQQKFEEDKMDEAHSCSFLPVTYHILLLHSFITIIRDIQEAGRI